MSDLTTRLPRRSRAPFPPATRPPHPSWSGALAALPASRPALDRAQVMSALWELVDGEGSNADIPA